MSVFLFKRGEWISIVGPSGSGKSTQLNIVAGLMEPDEGEVIVNERNMYALKERERTQLRRRHIGFVFQDFKLLPYYSVFDNVLLPIHGNKEKKKHKAKAEELLRTVGIDRQLFSRLPGNLSGGEKQRVAIARALVTNAEVILCDEATGNLDQENRNEIMSLLIDLKKRGVAILLVTHNLKAAQMGDRVYQLFDHMLIEQVS